MRSRILAFVVWTLLAASSVFWLLKMLARPLPAPPHAVLAGDARGAGADLSKLFGAAASQGPAPEAVPADDGRYRLIGLVAPKSERGHAHEGVAVIAVDGVPRTLRVGQALNEELQLLALDRQSVTLGREGQAGRVLRLDPLPPPATGSLPALALNSASVTLTPLPAPAPPPAVPTEPQGVQGPQGGPGHRVVPEVLPPGPNAVPLR